MTADVEAERDLARRYVRRLVAHGALLVPSSCTFVRTAIHTMEHALLAGYLHGCEHRAREADALFTIVPTAAPDGHVLGPHCEQCYADLPTRLVCEVCQRAPSPGLRTVVCWDRHHPTTVMVGRLCRDCRPGRVT